MKIDIYNGKQQVKAIWNDVRETVELSLPFAHEEGLLPEDVYTMLCQGRHDLWVFSQDERVMGYFVSEVFTDSTGEPCLHIVLLGAQSSGFIEEIERVVKDHLVACGIKKIQFSSSRKGMERFSNKFSIKEKYVVFEGTINESTN